MPWFLFFLFLRNITYSLMVNILLRQPDILFAHILPYYHTSYHQHLMRWFVYSFNMQSSLHTCLKWRIHLFHPVLGYTTFGLHTSTECMKTLNFLPVFYLRNYLRIQVKSCQTLLLEWWPIPFLIARQL